MSAIECLLILFLFSIKHFICDFPLQAYPYQFLNKGTYGHPGGVLHSSIHLVGSFLILVWFTDLYGALVLSTFDALVHYHIDWAKVNIGKKYNLKPDNSHQFWNLMGFDQFLHTLTYFAIVLFIVKNSQ